MIELHLRTKPLTVRGSVALKVHAVVANKGASHVRLIDQCMPHRVAQEVIALLTAGAKAQHVPLIVAESELAQLTAPYIGETK